MIYRRLAALGLGIAAFLLLAELVLRLLPTPFGIASAPPAADWPAKRLVPHSTYVSSSGWAMQNVQRGTINNAGYIAPFDYRPGAPAGVVLGDSFVEGLMNPYSDMLQARLAHNLGLQPDRVYNFGTSGAGLPHYLGLARLAGQTYRPQWAVVFVSARDFIEGFNRSPGFYSWRKGGGPIRLDPEKPKAAWKTWVTDLALVRYARLNLKFTPAVLTKSGFEAPAAPRCRRERLTPGDQRLVREWVRDMPAALRLSSQRIVLLFDADRTAIYQGQGHAAECRNRDWLARRFLAEVAAGAGMRIVDMAPIFRADFARNGRPFDRAPLDAHWSPYAHALAAQAVARALEPTPQSPAAPASSGS